MQVAAGLGAAIVFTLIASIIALVAFFQVGRIQREINTEHVPALTNAVQIGQLATTLAAAAPRLVAEARNRQLAADPEAEATPDEAAPSLDLLEAAARIIELSSELGAGERTAGLREFSERSPATCGTSRSRSKAASSCRSGWGQLQEATVVQSRELNELIVPLLDDQVFFMATGLRELGDDPAPLEVRGAEVE